MRSSKWIAGLGFLLFSSLLYAATEAAPTPLDKALFNMVGAGSVPQAKALIAKGAHVNVKQRPWGLTPLLIAPDVSREMVSFLLKQGADVNAADREGTTVLMRAVHSRDAEIVKEVLKYHPNLEAKGTWNNTALTYAVVQGNPLMVKALIDAGADINVLRADGMTPLDIAERRVMQASNLHDDTMPGMGMGQSGMTGHNMNHDAPKAIILGDSKAVLQMLQQLGAQAGYGAAKNAAVLQHHSHEVGH